MINTAETRNNYNANNNNKSVAITEADNKNKTDNNNNIKDASLGIVVATTSSTNTQSTATSTPPTLPTPTKPTTTTPTTTTSKSSSTTSSTTTPTTILSCSYDEIDDNTEDAIMKLIQHEISVEAGYLKDLLHDDMILMMNNNNNVMNVDVKAAAAAAAAAATATATALLRSNCAGENENDRPLLRLIDDVSIHDNKAAASLVEATTNTATTMTTTAMTTTTNTPTSTTTILLPFIDWKTIYKLMFANDVSHIVTTTQVIVEGWIHVLNQLNEISGYVNNNNNDVIYYYSQ